jgi:hypothetical protein
MINYRRREELVRHTHTYTHIHTQTHRQKIFSLIIKNDRIKPSCLRPASSKPAIQSDGHGSTTISSHYGRKARVHHDNNKHPPLDHNTDIHPRTETHHHQQHFLLNAAKTFPLRERMQTTNETAPSAPICMTTQPPMHDVTHGTWTPRPPLYCYTHVPPLEPPRRTHAHTTH